MSADRPADARERQILDVLRALVPGEVTTYGDVAEVAGHPRQSRLVGRILAATDVDVPWWRVVNAAGRLVPGHEREQTALLRAEGVLVSSGRVVRAPIGRFSPPAAPARPTDPRAPASRSPRRRGPAGR